jgi:K+-sensing histidine kinase KdpD
MRSAGWGCRMRADPRSTFSALGQGRLHAGWLTPVAICVAGVLVTSIVLYMVNSYLAAQHLVLGYLLPTTLIAVYYGSTFAVFTSFASALAAAYLLFPPTFSFYIADTMHVAELGFFLLLASIASKAMSVLTDDARRLEPYGRQRSNPSQPQ